MSKADRLFAKLGYEKVMCEDKDYDKNYIKYEKFSRTIIFKRENKRYCIIGKQKYRVYVTMQELQAIYLKCKELKWINE
jgi:hypothetical protein